MIAQLTRRRAALIVFAVSMALYAPSLANLFAYDDVAVIPGDTRIHSLKNVPTIFATSYWNNQAQALYRPLVSTSFAVDWSIASNHPGWYHFVNMLWNAAACVLVVLFLAELFPLAAALAGGLVFAVHPVHVEAVANIVGRAELMAAALGLAAALVWIRAQRWFALFVTLPVLFLLSLLCKESAIMLPPLLVLTDFATGRLQRRDLQAWLRQRAPVLAMMTVAAVAYLAQRNSVLHIFGPSNLDAALEVAPDGMPRILTALQVWPEYVRLFVFPRILLADYGPRILLPVTSLTPRAAVGLAILAGTIIGGVIAVVKGRRRTALALLWVPIAMLPVSNLLFPIGIIMAERTLYLPSIALAMAVAAVVQRAQPVDAASSRRRRAAWQIVLAVCCIFAVRTVVRIPDWKSTPSIFRALMRTRPDSFRAHWHLARSAAQSKKPKSALAEYAATLHLWPYRVRLLKESSNYAVQQHDLPFARQIAEQAVRAWPRDPDFRRSLAGINLDIGDTAAAVVHIREGLLLAPHDSILNAMHSALEHRTRVR